MSWLQKAFEAGEAAFKLGYSLADNPHLHTKNHDLRGSWNDGFRSARHEANEFKLASRLKKLTNS